MKQYLSSSNWQLNIYFYIKPVFSMFQKAINFDCLVLGDFAKFLLICELNF